MSDRDLAEIYGVETRVLNQAVKRNTSRFPEDFMFQLSKIETANLRSQIVTSSWGGSRYQPFAFTEQGVAMLASILKSDTAIQVNISIIRAFVAIRQTLMSPNNKVAELQTEIRQLKEYIEEVFTDYNDINDDTRMQIELINQSLAELQADKTELKKPRKRMK